MWGALLVVFLLSFSGATAATMGARRLLRVATRRRALPRSLRQHAWNLQAPNYLHIAWRERMLALTDGPTGALTCSQCGRVGNPNTNASCWSCGASYDLSRVANPRAAERLFGVPALTDGEVERLQRSYAVEEPASTARPRQVREARRLTRAEAARIVSREALPLDEAIAYLEGGDGGLHELGRYLKWQRNAGAGKRLVVWRDTLGDGTTRIEVNYVREEAPHIATTPNGIS